MHAFGAVTHAAQLQQPGIATAQKSAISTLRFRFYSHSYRLRGRYLHRWHRCQATTAAATVGRHCTSTVSPHNQACAAVLQWANYTPSPDPWSSSASGVSWEEDNDDSPDGNASSANDAIGAAAPGALRVAVAELPGSGRGLVATADIEPYEVILSVPLTHVFASAPDGPPDAANAVPEGCDRFDTKSASGSGRSDQTEAESQPYWAAEMAFRLLQACAAAGVAPGGSTGAAGTTAGSGSVRVSNGVASSSGSGGSSSAVQAAAFWRPWLEILPTQVVTPLQFIQEEVQAIEYEHAMAAVRRLQVRNHTAGITAALVEDASATASFCELIGASLH